MSDRVIVDEDGLWLVNAERTFGYPWPEISGASIAVLLLPPDDQRVVTIDVDHRSGHSPADIIDISLINEPPTV